MNVGPRGALGVLGLKRTISAGRRGAKRALLNAHPWYATADRCHDPAVFVVGCGRSGTTVLREMLNRHPSIAIGPESTFLCDFLNVERLAQFWELPVAEIRGLVDRSPSVVRFAEVFFRAHAAREGKARWGDKTPRNVSRLPWLMYAFPEARFVHIIRDGRDVACSRATFRTHKLQGGEVKKRRSPKTMTRAGGAADWVKAITTAAPFRGHPRYTEVRYEELIERPEAEARRLCGFLGEDFDDVMLDADQRSKGADAGRYLHNPDAGGAIRKTARGRWRRDLTHEQRRGVARVAGELLIQEGYAEDYGWVDEPVEREA